MSEDPARTWTAIVMAGERAGGDPLAAHFGAPLKALVPVAGEAMVSRVVRTLLAAPSVARVLILAQAPDKVMSGGAAWLAEDPRVAGAISGASLADAIEAVAGSAVAPWPVVITTADHPLLTVGAVEHFIAAITGADVAFGAVAKEVMDAAYPGNTRTWQRLRGGAYTGANLFALTGPAARAAIDLYRKIETDRKRPLKLLGHFGPLLALRAATRTISFEAALAAVGRRIGVSLRLVALPEAEAGIDVDKPSDHALAEEILAARR
jgi:GTP:adenosylcobinamide-phosphate guanylyltransferase